MFDFIVLLYINIFIVVEDKIIRKEDWGGEGLAYHK